ncbi:hypothetical protein GCM10009429_39450 [Dyella marensis]
MPRASSAAIPACARKTEVSDMGCGLRWEGGRVYPGFTAGPPVPEVPWDAAWGGAALCAEERTRKPGVPEWQGYFRVPGRLTSGLDGASPVWFGSRS